MMELDNLEIVKYGHSSLRAVSSPIEQIKQEYEPLVEKMIDLMYQEGGIGLAAPQVGVEKRLFIIDLQEPDDYPNEFPKNILYQMMPVALFNPEISFFDEGETLLCEEGCLSIPNVRGLVERPKKLFLSAQLIKGTAIKDIECDGLLSRCIQHELDHLNGVLFVDKLAKKEYKKVEKKLVKISQLYNG